MKKIFFTLLALVGTMSMNAQVMKIYNGETLVKEYKANEATHVVFEEAPAFGQGKAEATGIGNVKWIQLWAGGPKFAEYNVGAANNKAEDYGGYYAWGGSQDKVDDHKTGTDALSGDSDTATKLWGSNWRMPTSAELEELIANCDVEWTDSYKGSGKQGRIFTGKGAYSSNSVFLPAAGYCNRGNVYYQGNNGYYWSSTPNGSYYAYYLYFLLGYQSVDFGGRNDGCSVRAVLKETPATTGVAKATIGGSQVEVNWVQLWAGGPKFAEYNVGASSAADKGSTMTFTNATKAGADYVWGANWCTPSKEDMEHLMTAAKGKTDDKVKCEFTQEGSWYGFKFTGKAEGYTDNSVFFPTQYFGGNSGNADYWTATADGSSACEMYLRYYNGSWDSDWYSVDQDNIYLVRPVLKN